MIKLDAGVKLHFLMAITVISLYQITPFLLSYNKIIIKTGFQTILVDLSMKYKTAFAKEQRAQNLMLWIGIIMYYNVDNYIKKQGYVPVYSI